MQLFAGSLDNCLGSSDPALCRTVFLLNNDVDVGADVKAEARALIVAAYGVVNGLGEVTADEALRDGRAFIVGIASYLGQFGADFGV